MTVRADLDLSPTALRAAYRSGELSPEEVVDEVYRRIEARGHDGVWISVVPHAEARAAASSLDPMLFAELPLYGVPFSVKDNIDVAGLQTTAACPDFGYLPGVTATAVTRLLAAGAILVGKTNLDQFATGLSGARSPYGTPSSARHPGLVSGGSSSGAGVSVAAGLVAFAIGTDTAGSGRVPAALNGIVGLKPSIGLVSTSGVLPACASLDCLSVFAAAVGDAAGVLAVVAGFDATDATARRLPVPPPQPLPTRLEGLRLGVPATLGHWGDRGERAAWDDLLGALVDAGVVVVPVDPDPFLGAGRLLYGGPWVAERLAGLGDFVRTHPASVHPVTLEILSSAEQVTGADVFAGTAALRGFRRRVETVLAEVDALLTPTVTETFTITEMLDDPIRLNMLLGTWTTFTNLLDLCAVAVPAGGTQVPFGVSVQADGGRDAHAIGIAAAIEGLLAGSPAPGSSEPDRQHLDLAVVGAHLAGMPLHGDLLGCGAALVARTRTAPAYRLFALAGGPPYRPGLCRVSAGGTSIEVEVYRVPRTSMGDFLATIPAPLGIGRVVLADGSQVHGFICEPEPLLDAEDISTYGGWRAYLEARRKP